MPGWLEANSDTGVLTRVGSCDHKDIRRRQPHCLERIQGVAIFQVMGNGWASAGVWLHVASASAPYVDLGDHFEPVRRSGSLGLIRFTARLAMHWNTDTCWVESRFPEEPHVKRLLVQRTFWGTPGRTSSCLAQTPPSRGRGGSASSLPIWLSLGCLRAESLRELKTNDPLLEAWLTQNILYPTEWVEHPSRFQTRRRVSQTCPPGGGQLKGRSWPAGGSELVSFVEPMFEPVPGWYFIGKSYPSRIFAKFAKPLAGSLLVLPRGGCRQESDLNQLGDRPQPLPCHPRVHVDGAE